MCYLDEQGKRSTTYSCDVARSKDELAAASVIEVRDNPDNPSRLDRGSEYRLPPESVAQTHTRRNVYI